MRFKKVLNVRLLESWIVRFWETMALCGENYGSFWLKVPQTLIAFKAFSDSGNVIHWERLRRSVFFNIRTLSVKGFSRATRGRNLVVSVIISTFVA